MVSSGGNFFCILIFAALCSGVVMTKSEPTTLSSFTSSSAKSIAKVKRQYQFPFARPVNYSPFVGDAALDSSRYADAHAQTINQVDQKDINGNFNYAYETTNGIKVRQTSYITNQGRVVVGYYSYLGPDGKIYTTHYTADQHGYRATGSHLPVQETAVQPLPFVSSTPDPIPFVSSTPAPFISSTPGHFGPSTPAPFVSSSPFNVPSPTPYRGFIGYSPTTTSPIVSSSTPVASTVSPFSVSRRPNFPIYGQRTVPFQGYAYTNPRINTPYSVVSQQTPAPIFFPSSSETPLNRFSYATAPSNIDSRITTTFSPPPRLNNLDGITSSRSPLNDDIPVRFKQYIPPAPIVSSTPRPFDSFSPHQPDTILITPKPSINQPVLPNSLSVNQNLLPPYLSVGPLNSPQFSGRHSFNTNFRENANFINSPPYEFNDQVRPQTVAPLTVTNLNFRKK
ncbi:mucin-2-like isoform X2 [Sitodiplosis mosellana]|uniref:mucin-2-like isoform X2 n=1 Tax=Sitodiplosis mosellana TaxID=263140 RepID=UPI0024441F4F|nr:mucin-2-like isoform X2 [Sitodiplosis mosellana]